MELTSPQLLCPIFLAFNLHKSPGQKGKQDSSSRLCIHSSFCSRCRDSCCQASLVSPSSNLTTGYLFSSHLLFSHLLLPLLLTLDALVNSRLSNAV